VEVTVKSISEKQFFFLYFLYLLSVAIIQMDEVLYNRWKKEYQNPKTKTPINQYIRCILALSGIISRNN